MPRTKEQFHEMRENSRILILNSALKLFSTKGYHGTTIQAIAKEAKIASGLVYNYFESKEKLLDELIIYAANEFNQTLQQKTKELIQTDELETLIYIMMDTIKENLSSWKLFIHLFIQSNVNMENASFDVFFNDLYKVAVRYYTNRNADDPNLEAKVLLDLLHGTILSYIIGEDEKSLEFTLTNLMKKFLL